MTHPGARNGSSAAPRRAGLGRHFALAHAQSRKAYAFSYIGSRPFGPFRGPE